MTIKAIETVFKGYRFRSRLEARWAVFFDAMGVEFQYEPEGYELPSGWYLPDFFIPSERTFIEIKPGPQPTNYLQRIEQRLAFELMRATNRSVYVFYGDPVDALAPGYPGMSGFHADDDDNSLSFLYLQDHHSAGLKARQARFEHGQAPA